MFKTTDLVRSIFQLLFWALVAWLLYTVRDMIVYLIIAGILTLIGKPIVRFLHKLRLYKWHLPLWACSLLTILLFISVIAGIATAIVPEFIREAKILAQIDFAQVYSRFQNEINSTQQFLTDWNLLPELSQFNVRESLADIFTVDTIQGTFNALIGFMGNIGIAIFSILFILFFFLKERTLADATIRNFVPDKYSEHLRAVVPKVRITLTRYFIGLVSQLSLVFLIVYFGMKVIGVDNALVIALFAAMMNVIPYIGPLIGSTFGIILGMGQALAVDPEVNLLMTFVKLLSVFLVAQAVDNNLSQPLILSRSIHAHPLEIFLVISVAGTLAGMAGMIIAVPLYSVLRIIAKEFQVDVKFIKTLSKDA